MFCFQIRLLQIVFSPDGNMAEDNPFRFSTKYFDQETGLIAYIFRYYDIEMGRWLTRDPLEEPGSVLLRKETEKKKTDLNLYVSCPFSSRI